MLISEVLSLKGGEIFAIEPDAPVAAAVAKMVEHDVGSLVVKEDAHMVGIVTERDVLRALHRVGCDLKHVRVRELMTREPIIGHPSDTVDYARGVMTEHRFSHLPVMDGNRLLGIISFHDVAKACLAATHFENRLLKRYIRNWPE